LSEKDSGAEGTSMKKAPAEQRTDWGASQGWGDKIEVWGESRKKVESMVTYPGEVGCQGLFHNAENQAVSLKHNKTT